jgi:hypothetical protein
MRPRREALLVAAVLVLTLLVAAAPAHADFGVQTFSAGVFKDAAGAQPETQAGAHPLFGITKFTFNQTAFGTPDGNVENVRVDVPPGLISNPLATPHCSDAQFDSLLGCPADTQIGTETLTTEVVPLLPITVTLPVFNMVTSPNQVSVFAFNAPVFGRTDIVGGVRDDSDYGLYFEIREIPELAGLVSSELKFWGVPSQHPGGVSTKPFISLPTECGIKGTATLTVESWPALGHPNGQTVSTPADAAPLKGCDQVPFDPSIDVAPATTQADEPTGAVIDLQVPQTYSDNDGDGLATAHVKNVSVTLPEGMTINPAAANGLAGCADPRACPPTSQIGTVEISTPVLPDKLIGAVYLGQPLPDDPYRLFVVAEGPNFTVRLTGSVHPNPQSGRLTATFNDTPRVPFTDFKLTFHGGTNATLATPLACGKATTTSALTPYTGQPPATP